MNNEKIHKRIAASGLCSRRRAEELVAYGRVRINRRRAMVGERVGIGDRIEVDGKPLRINARTQSSRTPQILAYHKPVGEICSHSDSRGRRTVYQSLPSCTGGRWISVGRLDFNTSGLLLFADDGTWANGLAHPSANIEREYVVRVQGVVTKQILERLRQGVMLDDGMASFSDIHPVERDGEHANCWFYVVLMSGRNREVRRLWESQRLRVSRLKRVRFGNIILSPGLAPGSYQLLSGAALDQLLSLARVTERRVPAR